MGRLASVFVGYIFVTRVSERVAVEGGKGSISVVTGDILSIHAADGKQDHTHEDKSEVEGLSFEVTFAKE